MGDATYNKQAAFSLEKHLISVNERKKIGALNVHQVVQVCNSKNNLAAHSYF